MTRYAIEQVQSRVVYHQPQETVTALDSPITFNFTFKQGATEGKGTNAFTATSDRLGNVWHVNGINRSCSLDISNTRGPCVDIVEQRLAAQPTGTATTESLSTTILSTYTAPSRSSL
ncbi:unnamed protein product [Cyclocybe aegerita]|uniref:Uncharacterized protein n=1 Tax=Cyclocybe aegerita TaxID=1973307 RepID=A0A8S0WKF6_CYCAE|nr:unnamed protein product [Cyclocybe aegerita]